LETRKDGVLISKNHVVPD